MAYSTTFIIVVLLFLWESSAVDWAKLARGAQKVGDILDNGVESEIGREFSDHLTKVIESLVLILHHFMAYCVIGFIIFCILIVWLILEVRRIGVNTKHLINTEQKNR